MLKLIFPYTCIFCGSTKCKGLDLCIDCQSTLPIINIACTQCARPLTLAENKICGTCLNNPPPYAKTIALYSYANPTDFLITQLKFHNKLLYANILGKLLTQKLQVHYASQQKPEVIIPVPLHIKRLKERGYNQALEIARPIAKQLHIPIDKHCCVRSKDTEMQSTLSSSARKTNVKNAFTLRAKIPYKHAAIIDDVITTGNTITEFCKILCNNGVTKIDVWCCARAHFLL